MYDLDGYAMHRLASKYHFALIYIRPPPLFAHSPWWKSFIIFTPFLPCFVCPCYYFFAFNYLSSSDHLSLNYLSIIYLSFFSASISSISTKSSDIVLMVEMRFSFAHFFSISSYLLFLTKFEKQDWEVQVCLAKVAHSLQRAWCTACKEVFTWCILSGIIRQ